MRNPVVAVVYPGDEGDCHPGIHVRGKGLCQQHGNTCCNGAAQVWDDDSLHSGKKDDAEEISAALESLYNIADVIITSGGAWTGDRDMVHQDPRATWLEIYF